MKGGFAETQELPAFRDQGLGSSVIRKPEPQVRTMRPSWRKNIARRQHRQRSGLLWPILFPYAGVQISTLV